MAASEFHLENIKIGGQTVDLNYYLSHAYDDISEAASELPAVIEWLNDINQGYVERMHLLKAQLKQAKAKAYFDLTDPESESSFAKKFPRAKSNVVALTHAVELDAVVRRIEAELATLRAWVERLRQAQNALFGKLELVRSAESTRRKVFFENEREEE